MKMDSVKCSWIPGVCWYIRVSTFWSKEKKICTSWFKRWAFCALVEGGVEVKVDVEAEPIVYEDVCKPQNRWNVLGCLGKITQPKLCGMTVREGVCLGPHSTIQRWPLQPHMASVLFSYVDCKGGSKARMLATLLSRDERDQLQPWLWNSISPD